MSHHHHFATIYKITERDDTPIVLREGETVPRHADLLRSDLAFCDPAEIAKVVFPVFKGKNGRTSPQITRARWTSCDLLVERYDKDVLHFGDWTTYRYEDGDSTRPLVPVTLSQYLAQHPGEKVAMWR
jgi:hypothetical protein